MGFAANAVRLQLDTYQMRRDNIYQIPLAVLSTAASVISSLRRSKTRLKKLWTGGDIFIVKARNPQDAKAAGVIGIVDTLLCNRLGRSAPLTATPRGKSSLSRERRTGNLRFWYNLSEASSLESVRQMGCELASGCTSDKRHQGSSVHTHFSGDNTSHACHRRNNDSPLRKSRHRHISAPLPGLAKSQGTGA